MSSLAAYNLRSKLPNLQALPVSLPWVKMSIVRCFSSKAGHPDFPVRYIPNKPRQVNRKQCYSPGDDAPHTTSTLSNGLLEHKEFDRIQCPQGSTTDHNVHGECQKTNKHGKRAVKTKCLKSFQETVEHVTVHEEVVQELHISKRDGQDHRCSLNEVKNNHYGVVNPEYTESQTCRSKQGAEKIAIELLAKRALTGVELQKKLTAKQFPVSVVEAVVRNFQDRGFINDRLYAEVYSFSRWKSSSWGPWRIKQVLVKKGISEGDAEKAVKLVFEDKHCNERSNITLSDSSLEQLYVQASKQWQRCRDVLHQTRKARVIRWLQYRGFDWGVTSIIVKKLESEYP